MASGNLGIASLSANTDTVVYTTPSGTLTALSINIVNISETSDAFVTVSISANTTPVAGEYIEYKTKLNPTGLIERTGIMTSAGEKIIVRSNINNVNVRVYGVEEFA